MLQEHKFLGLRLGFRGSLDPNSLPEFIGIYPTFRYGWIFILDRSALGFATLLSHQPTMEAAELFETILTISYPLLCVGGQLSSLQLGKSESTKCLYKQNVGLREWQFVQKSLFIILHLFG